MRWWASQPAAWEACRERTEEPEQAPGRFHAWVQLQSGTLGLPVMVAFPASYRAMWAQRYLLRFVSATMRSGGVRSTSRRWPWSRWARAVGGCEIRSAEALAAVRQAHARRRSRTRSSGVRCSCTSFATLSARRGDIAPPRRRKTAGRRRPAPRPRRDRGGGGRREEADDEARTVVHPLLSQEVETGAAGSPAELARLRVSEGARDSSSAEPSRTREGVRSPGARWRVVPGFGVSGRLGGCPVVGAVPNLRYRDDRTTHAGCGRVAMAAPSRCRCASERCPSRRRVMLCDEAVLSVDWTDVRVGTREDGR